MPAKTPKSWKSTAECIARTREMSRSTSHKGLIVFQEDNFWRWKIEIRRYVIGAVIKVVLCTRNHRHEDEAANEAYKWAYKWAYKHLRSRRRKKVSV